MFSNKKNSLPPRPCLPDYEHMLEDLNNSVMDDVAFKIINEICKKESYGPATVNDSDDIYKKVKTYLSIKQQLRQLEYTLKREGQQLQTDSEEIGKLADNIRKQAQAALVTGIETTS